MCIRDRFYCAAFDPAPAARPLIFAGIGHRLSDAAHVGISARCVEDYAEPRIIIGGFAQRDFRPASEFCFDSVSYTHLDVYKRQGW